MASDVTSAEAALLATLEGLLDGGRIRSGGVLQGRKVLVAGNRSGLIVCALAKAGAEVTAHVFDIHHAKAMQGRLREARLDEGIVRCTANVPKGAYDRAYFMTTPLSMTGELVLDQLEDIRTNLAVGGELFAAFEGDPQESLKTMKKVFARVHVLPTQAQSRRDRRRGVLSLFRAVKGEADANAKRRSFAAEWTASVPGGEMRTFVSLPGCFCHRRADVGGLALAETACAQVGGVDGGELAVLDMGCGCGFVGLLAVDFLRARGHKVRLTLLDSHARALAAAKVNAERLGFADARLVLADDGVPEGDDAGYDLFLGNPPYYGDWRIAETFIATARRALRKGGVCMTVAKSDGGLHEIQAKAFGDAAVTRRRGYCVFSSIHP